MSAPTVPRLFVTASPHLKPADSTPRSMWNVVGSLGPVIAASAWFFGISALLVIAAAVLGSVAAERAFGKGGSLADGELIGGEQGPLGWQEAHAARSLGTGGPGGPRPRRNLCPRTLGRQVRRA